MMSFGENERQRALDALAAQTFKDWELFEIRDRPNREAHRELYRTFMASGAQCYLKLDADMVLKEDVLGYLVEHTATADIVSVNVDDWPSLLNIPAMMMFSSWCKWTDNDDSLNVDATPRNRSGRRIQNQPWVDHMPDPHDFQAFRYGVHKALKLLQRGRAPTNRGAKLKLHSMVLKHIWKHRARDRRRGLAILGAECVFSGKYPELYDDYAGTGSRRVFEAVQGMDVGQFAPLWNVEETADRRLAGLAQAAGGLS